MSSEMKRKAAMAAKYPTRSCTDMTLHKNGGHTADSSHESVAHSMLAMGPDRHHDDNGCCDTYTMNAAICRVVHTRGAVAG